VLQFIYMFYVDAGKLPVNTQDDGDGNRGFACGDSDNKYGEKVPLQLIGKQIAVEGHKIDVHRVEDQLNRHQDGDQVPSREKAVNTNEEHDGAQDQEILKRDVGGYHNYVLSMI
jgi:hypothetical protein